MAMLDKVLSGFKKLGGHAWEYIFETAAIAINFISRAGDMGGGTGIVQGFKSSGRLSMV